MKDLGLLQYFLGIKLHTPSDGMILSYNNYVMDLLHKFGLSNVKPLFTPLALKSSLSAYEGDPLPDPTVYRQMVGDLQYGTMTCHDILYAVSLVSHYMHQPRQPHL